MRIEVVPHSVELKITETVPPGLPCGGDLRVEAWASVSAFVGHGDCWIEAEQFRSFAASVETLYRHFDGRAELNSISPGEFSLTLSPANPRGYVLVQVAIRRQHPVQASMSGAFEVELPGLAELVTWATKQA